MNIQSLGIVGTGQMGAGILHAFAASGFQVVACNRSESGLQRGLAAFEGHLRKGLELGKLDAEEVQVARSRIRPTTRLEDLAEVDFVVEAATEDRAIKTELIRSLDRTCRPGTILATNTSTISITCLGGLTGRPERVVGMHFFNPVPAMPLVEVIRGLATSEETCATVSHLAERLGKRPVSVLDSPGFAVNRVFLPLLNEAFFVLDEGVTEAQALDAMFRLGCHHPMGPLELADLIGLDTVLAGLEELHRATLDPKFRPCPLLRRYVDAGWLGRKSGRGFYEYREA